jgi:hypothetical protein
LLRPHGRSPGRLPARSLREAELAGSSGLASDRVEADAYDLTDEGRKAVVSLGIDLEAVRSLRRRFAYACVDWSERRPHIGGALGNAILQVALKQQWFVQDLDSRALTLTAVGRRQMQARFGLKL